MKYNKNRQILIAYSLARVTCMTTGGLPPPGTFNMDNKKCNLAKQTSRNSLKFSHSCMTGGDNNVHVDHKLHK